MPFKNIPQCIAWAFVAVFFVGIIFGEPPSIEKILIAGFIGLICAIMSLE